MTTHRVKAANPLTAQQIYDAEHPKDTPSKHYAHERREFIGTTEGPKFVTSRVEVDDSGGRPDFLYSDLYISDGEVIASFRASVYNSRDRDYTHHLQELLALRAVLDEHITHLTKAWPVVRDKDTGTTE